MGIDTLDGENEEASVVEAAKIYNRKRLPFSETANRLSSWNSMLLRKLDLKGGREPSDVVGPSRRYINYEPQVATVTWRTETASAARRTSLLLNFNHLSESRR